MYQGKHTTSNKNAVSRRRTALILSIVLILTCAVGGSLAYFTDLAFSASSFQIGEVTCTAEVGENGSVTVTNTGDGAAYIRVSVVANVVGDSGTIYYSQPTVSLKDSGAADWEAKDGYFYHKQIVQKGASVTLPLTFSNVSAGSLLKLNAFAEAVLQSSDWGYTPSEG